MLKRYQSYVDFVEATKLSRDYRQRHSNTDFFGDADYSECINRAENGYEKYVSEAETMLDKLSSIENGDALREWSPSVCGAYPIVPEFLAGHPLCMRSLQASDKLAPVSLYACSTLSSAISVSDMLKRGTAILALAMKLQQTRPVELYITSEVHGATDGDYIQVIPIPSRPLSLAHACYALCSPGFTRHLTYTVARHDDSFNGCWGVHYNELNAYSDATKYIKWITGVLELTPNDLYIKPAHWNDSLIKTPLEWINEQLARYNGIE